MKVLHTPAELNGSIDSVSLGSQTITPHSGNSSLPYNPLVFTIERQRVQS